MSAWIIYGLVMPGLLVALGWGAVLWTERKARLMDRHKATRPAE